jgi:hypothetical protein
MKCPQCDFENEEGSMFCKNCNIPLSKQDYSEDNPYIKKKGNEDQPFELIPNEEEKEETKINMIKKIWKDLFHSSEVEDLPIASKEDIEEIIDMFIADRIDPEIFISNLEALLRGGMPSLNDFLGTEEKPKTSKSISSFTSIVNRPMGTPLWFLAGYPDVMNWFNDQEEKYSDQDGWETEMAKLWGLDAEDENINENQSINSDGKLHPKYCNNLKKHYKETTKKKLEVSVDENSNNNIYLGAELLNMMGAESNFTLIAENTTKYYLELTKNYKNRINNEVFLLATAGILDAQFYIFMEKTINPAEIIDIAKKAVSSGKDALINFIIKLEIKLFKIDNPAMDISEIEKGCIKQKVAILKTIQKTKEKYNSEPRVTLEVEVFMNSIKFKPYRKMLEIKNKFLFF